MSWLGRVLNFVGLALLAHSAVSAAQYRALARGETTSRLPPDVLLELGAALGAILAGVVLSARLAPAFKAAAPLNAMHGVLGRVAEFAPVPRGGGGAGGGGGVSGGGGGSGGGSGGGGGGGGAPPAARGPAPAARSLGPVVDDLD